MTADDHHDGLITLADQQESIDDYFVEHGWSDGLPVVAPTPERVEAMLKYSPYPAGKLIGLMDPRWGEVTPTKLAINAVMAGCRPEYFPVVVAAVEAVLDPSFNLFLVQSTTHPSTPLIVVSGPIVRELGFNSGPGCYGPGSRANATVGRALQLALVNIGGATPGKFDRGTQSHPGKYTFCIAESQDANPWEPVHVDRGGLQFSDSAVTVMAAEGPHNLNDHVSANAVQLLSSLCQGMASATMNNAYLMSDAMLVLGPEHADTIAGDGWNKKEIQRFVYENARISLRKLKMGVMWQMRDWPKWYNTVDDEAMLPIIENAEDLVITVAGGVGKHSSFLPNVGHSRAVTRRIAWGK